MLRVQPMHWKVRGQDLHEGQGRCGAKKKKKAEASVPPCMSLVTLDQQCGFFVPILFHFY